MAIFAMLLLCHLFKTVHRLQCLLVWCRQLCGKVCKHSGECSESQLSCASLEPKDVQYFAGDVKSKHCTDCGSTGALLFLWRLI